MNTTERISINYLDREKVLNYYRNIKPLIKKHGKYFVLKGLTDQQLIYYPFSWINEEDGIFEEPADIFEYSALEDQTITILSLFHFEGKNAPTYAEVISQISKKINESIVAFEVVKDSKTSYDYEHFGRELAAGFYITEVKLYTKKINNQRSVNVC